MEEAASFAIYSGFQFQFKPETVCAVCVCRKSSRIFFYLGAGKRERGGEQVLLT